MAEHEGNLIATDLRMALIVSRFNRFITEKLMEGATDAFARHGGDVAQLDLIWVPGAFEMPLTAKRLAQNGSVSKGGAGKGYDALVALGAVIRGATPHFDFVSAAAATGLSKVTVDTGVPVAFGVLTTDNVEQAIERAGSKAGNKGGEAMLTAIEMANLLKNLG